MMMKFEFLPNEIFLQAFQYLNASDLFYSFDQLNYHFSTFIRNIPLHLNFFQMKKSTFNHHCQTMLLNCEIKQRIVYLQLSNNGTSGQIESFLSRFSFNDFINLRSLSLIDLTNNNIEQLLPMLSLLSNLYSFSFTGTTRKTLEIISALPKSKLQILTVPNFEFQSTFINETLGITSLTISDSKFDNCDLFKLFEYVPMLKYFKIECLTNTMIKKDQSNMINKNHIHLKELIINHCKTKFGNLELLLKYLPNLKLFSIFIDNDMNMFDAIHWQKIIESSLKHLSVFKFYFRYDKFGNSTDKLNKCQQFQTNFWHEQHQWYTNWEISSHSSTIYTIPYERNNYELTRDTNKSGYLLIKNSNLFDNVKTLSISPKLITNDSTYYFKNVELLKLTNDSDDDDDDDDDDETEIKCLDRIVNSSNIKHLIIDEEFSMTSSELLDLLKQLPNVSSLTIDDDNLMLMKIFDNIDLCKYLNKHIKKLDVSTGECLDQRIFPNKINFLFSHAFSNLEQFSCDYFKEVDDLLLILKQCSNLLMIKSEIISKSVHKWIQGNASKLNVYLDFKSVNEDTDDDDDDDYDFSDEE